MDRKASKILKHKATRINKLNLEFANRPIKHKVDYDKFIALERRVLLLEKK